MELKVLSKDIINEVIKVVSFNEPLALVARVHGYPAKLVVRYVSFHKVPYLSTHHRNWVQGREEEELARFINLISIAKELA